jgi:hypothetical protein
MGGCEGGRSAMDTQERMQIPVVRMPQHRSQQKGDKQANGIETRANLVVRLGRAGANARAARRRGTVPLRVAEAAAAARGAASHAAEHHRNP